jgi:hypothetical protein
VSQELVERDPFPQRLLGRLRLEGNELHSSKGPSPRGIRAT